MNTIVCFHEINKKKTSLKSKYSPCHVDPFSTALFGLGNGGIDFGANNKEPWNLLHRIESNPTRTKMVSKIKLDKFANIIVEMTRATMDKETARKITMSLKTKN
ncbi:hypothetical protein QTP88_004482 [Uroleucon formosanum]